MALTIKIDSREQRPYEFKNTEVGTLQTGDYSIQGLENYIAIERKELNDLIGCLTTGRERFKRELYRGRALEYFALVVEASLSDIVSGKYRSKMNPEAAMQSLIAFSIRYRLPVWFAENRELSQHVTESLLSKYAKEIERRYQAIQGAVL